MRLTPVFLLLLFTPVYVHASETVLLENALQQARQNALQMLQLEAELEFARSDAGKADAPHDLILFGNLVWQEDRTESSSAFAGKRRNTLNAEGGVRKVFRKATALETKLAQTRNRTVFPPADPTAGPDASAFQSFNPSYRTILEINASQPLWRNWLGREFEMQRELLQSDVAPAELNLKLQEQLVQAEMEQFYWNLAEIEAQLRLKRRLIELSKKFSSLMRERVKYGRADQVDVADADASVITQEGQLLDLIFAAQHYRRQIRMGMNPAEGFPDDVSGPAHIYLPESILETGGPAHVAASADDAYAYALGHRVDLQVLGEQKKPLKAELALVKEQNKPSVNLFGGVGKAGLEGRWDNSVVDTFDDGKHVQYSIGIEAEVNLQKSALGAQEGATIARLKAFDAQSDIIKSGVRREIEFAFSGFESARRKRVQAVRSIESLEAKRRAEIKKFKQARSEEIVVLSYELEALAARSGLIAADKLARDSDVRLRMALHAYSSSR